MKINGVEIKQQSDTIDSFLGQAVSSRDEDMTKVEVKKKASAEVFPTHKFRQLGARVYQKTDGFVVDFGRMTIARTSNIDETFIRKVLGEDNDELVNISAEPLWEVKKLGNKRFYIKRK